MNDSNKTKFPSNWIKEGFVVKHPEDRAIYPIEFRTVDPETFSLRPREDGEGHYNWGLPELKLESKTDHPNIPSDIPPDFVVEMERMMYNSNIQVMYCEYPSPYDQYIGILARRKIRDVKSTKIQEACKTTLRIKSLC